MNMYFSLVSYRNEQGEVVRVEGKGTFEDCVRNLAQFNNSNVISAEICRLTAQVAV